MNVSLDWPSDVVVRLTDDAQKRGLSLDGYLLHLALEKKAARKPRGGGHPEAPGAQRGWPAHSRSPRGTSLGRTSLSAN